MVKLAVTVTAAKVVKLAVTVTAAKVVKLAVTVTAAKVVKLAVTVTAAKVVKLAAIVTAAKVVKLASTATAANSEHFLSSNFLFLHNITSVSKNGAYATNRTVLSRLLPELWTKITLFLLPAVKVEFFCHQLFISPSHRKRN